MLRFEDYTDEDIEILKRRPKRERYVALMGDVADARLMRLKMLNRESEKLLTTDRYHVEFDFQRPVAP